MPWTQAERDEINVRLRALDPRPNGRKPKPLRTGDYFTQDALDDILADLAGLGWLESRTPTGELVLEKTGTRLWRGNPIPHRDRMTASPLFDDDPDDPLTLTRIESDIMTIAAMVESHLQFI